jgi:hypothetical protein
VASLLQLAFAGCAGPDPAAPVVVADFPVAAADAPDAPDVSPLRDAAAEAAIPLDAAGPTDAPTDADAAAVDAGVAACAFGAPCPSGSQCYTTACLPFVPMGGRCEIGDLLAHPCEFRSDCAPDASGVHHCVPYGTEGAFCHRSSIGSGTADCDAGLACVLEVSGVSGYYRCRPGLRAGELCAGSSLRCPTDRSCCGAGTTCQPVNGTDRCVATPPDGAAGGACLRQPETPDGVATRCPDGLQCTANHLTEPNAALCVRVVPVGSDCAGAGVGCGPDASCIVSAGAARCVAHGAPGGRCRAAAPFCDAGVRCDTPSGWGVCRSVVALGGECDAAALASVCAEGLSCTTADPTEPGRCVAPGTAAGADCRASAPACDGALRCSNFSRYRSTCRVEAAVGDPCDLGAIRTLCPDGSRCVPAAGVRDGVAVAVCAPSVPEVEPNDVPTTAGASVARSTLYRGALSASDPRDCFAVSVAEGGSLYVEVAPAGLLVSLFDPMGAEIGRWVPSGDGGGGALFNSARLRPEALGVLRAMRAGAYVACVSSPATPAVTYLLALGVLAAGS